MDERSQSLSLLDEIKDLASRDAQVEKHPQSRPSQVQSGSQHKIPKQNSLAGLGLELSKALADVHESVSLDAQQEEKRRTQSIHYQEAKALEKHKNEEQRRTEEVEMRLASERARQDAIQEERRLKHLRLQYEAALARGENVEMPEELKPPKVIVMPVVQTAIEKQEIEIQEAEEKNHKTFLIGGLVALALILSAVFIFLNSTPELPVNDSKTTKIEVPKKPEVDTVALELEKRKAREVELAAERKKQAEEVARLKAEKDAKLAAKKSRKKKRRKKKKKKKKRLKLGKDLLGGD